VCRSCERGVALVAAAAGLALLSILATGLAYTAVLAHHLARNALAAVQADALLRSGVAAAAVVLRETSVRGMVDSEHSPWATGSGRHPLGAGWIEARVEDEARRLDVNRFPWALPRLLELLDLDPRLAEAIADWMDPDDAARPGGAERDWYLGLVPPYLPRNGSLSTVGELGLVRGLDPAALRRLGPHLTVADETGVNPNTASREVLLALGAVPASVDRLLAVRARRPVLREELRGLLPGVPAARLTLRSRHYTVRVLAGVGPTRRAAEATISALEGTDPEIVSWRPR